MNIFILIKLKYASNESKAQKKLDEAVSPIKAKAHGNVLPKKAELLRVVLI